MARAAAERGLIVQLRMMLLMADADPKRWVAGTVVASLVLAGLDTLGVAAMVPLTQLLTGDTSSPVIQWISDVFDTSQLSTLIPIVAGFIALVFIVKSAASIWFRWWLLAARRGSPHSPQQSWRGDTHSLRTSIIGRAA